jgi:hypothetical protein
VVGSAARLLGHVAGCCGLALFLLMSEFLRGGACLQIAYNIILSLPYSSYHKQEEVTFAFIWCGRRKVITHHNAMIN